LNVHRKNTPISKKRFHPTLAIPTSFQTILLAFFEERFAADAEGGGRAN